MSDQRNKSIQLVEANYSEYLIPKTDFRKALPEVKLTKKHLEATRWRDNYAARNDFHGLQVRGTKGMISKALMFYDNLLRVLGGMGYEVVFGKGTGGVLINGIKIDFEVREVGKRIYNVGNWGGSDTKPTGRIAFKYWIRTWSCKELIETTKPMESYIPKIIMRFEEMAIKEQEWQRNIERERIIREKEQVLEKERKQIERDNLARRENLIRETEDWHQAQRVRAYIREAVSSELKSKEWEEWAFSIAEEIDPLL